MSKKPSSVRIELDLFYDILTYLKLHENAASPLYVSIQQRVVDKLGRMLQHDYYTDYMTARTEQDRFENFNRYLKELGMPDELRYGLAKVYLDKMKSSDNH